MITPEGSRPRNVWPVHMSLGKIPLGCGIEEHILAERQGFEPWVGLLILHPLSRRAPSTTRPSLRGDFFILGQRVAEGVGFEPTELSLYGFQDRRLRPLGHPSMTQEF